MSFSKVATLLGLGVIGCLIGCGIFEPRLCDEQFSTAGHYEVNLIELQTDMGMFKSNPGITTAAYYNSAGSCSGRDGLVGGSQLLIQGDGKFLHMSKSCNVVRAKIETVPPSLTLEKARTDVPAGLAIGGDIFATADVSFGDCRGQMALEIFGGAASGAFSRPMPGDYPPVGVYRLFVPSEGSCPICDDNFAGQLVRK